MMRPDYSVVDFNEAFKRKRSASAYAKAVAALKEQAKQTVADIVKSKNESCLLPPADRIVLRCLRDLCAIPSAEREFGRADVLLDLISLVYLETSETEKQHARRATELWKIEVEE